MFDSTGKAIFSGIIGSFLQDGIDINKIDWETETMYITLPAQSYRYDICKNNETILTSPENYAKRIKETFHEMGIFQNGKVKYRVKDIYWTKEMGEKNFKENINKYLDMMR